MKNINYKKLFNTIIYLTYFIMLYLGGCLADSGHTILAFIQGLCCLVFVLLQNDYYKSKKELNDIKQKLIGYVFDFRRQFYGESRDKFYSVPHLDDYLDEAYKLMYHGAYCKLKEKEKNEEQ